MRKLGTMLVALAAIASGAPAAPRKAPAKAPKPKLIVAISIDQFAAAVNDRYRPSYRYGLKRLNGGVTFSGYQSHAATETCPGHSTILTGRHPATTGIVANSWVDRATGKGVYCVSVPGAPADARGPQNLHVDTFGDWLKAAEPGARVFSISGKDRAAIMLAGHHPDGVWWWQDGKGFTTSSYAGPDGEAITAPAKAFDAMTIDGWKATPPTFWPAPDARCAALQKPHRFGDLEVSGKVPPDQAAAAQAAGPDAALFQDQLHSTPLFDRLVLDYAKQTIDREHLGRGPKTDLLALSFSATDYVGHRFGPGGAEMCVQITALDRTLGDLFAKLDSLHVPYAVVLTADHGSTDAAERLTETGVKAIRFDPKPFLKKLNGKLQADFELAKPPLAAEDVDQLTIMGVPDADRMKVRDAAVAWLREQPEVYKVMTADEIAAAVPPKGKPVTALTFAERAHESFDRERSGDIEVVYQDHTSMRWPAKPGDYIAGHGSPWDGDRRVPILFWWPGAPARPQPKPAETVDIAPTLAAIAGIAAPPVDGQCLRTVTGSCPK